MQTTLHITGLSHDGSGVGRDDGKVVFVPGALPDETVTVTLGESKKGITHADLEAIVQANPKRRTPPCGMANLCGGCPLQIAGDDLQAEIKAQQVRDALSRIGKLDCEVLPVRTMADPWRYRNKGIFHVDDSQGEARLGFFEKGSHALVPASQCVLFSEQVNHLTVWLEDAITQSGIAGDIDKVMIRESRANGEMMVVLVTAGQKFRHERLVKALQAEWPQVVSIWHNINTNPRLMLGRAFTHLAGKETISETLGDLHYDLSPASFFQVNTAQAEVLYQCGKDMIDVARDASILDLYCGIGTIGSFIAERTQSLTGVDSVGQAIEDAKKAAKANGFNNARFTTAKAEVWLPKWLGKGNYADLAIIDPPRKGCDAKLLDALIQAEIPQILCISCNPATLARDLAHLAPYYNIGPVQPVDLFPHTSHVENVVVLKRK